MDTVNHPGETWEGPEVTSYAPAFDFAWLGSVVAVKVVLVHLGGSCLFASYSCFAFVLSWQHSFAKMEKSAAVEKHFVAEFVAVVASVCIVVTVEILAIAVVVA